MSLSDGIFRRRRLPHWDVADATYFVTTCLEGSIPAAGLNALSHYRQELDSQPRPAAQTVAEWETYKHKLLFKRLDEWLDHQPAVRYFDEQNLCMILRDAFYFFAGQRYFLQAFVVMPSHFHWVFTPTPAYCEEIAGMRDGRTPRECIMKSIKGYTARRCNALLGRTGTFWQDESYDHVVRDSAELERIIQYVELNPVQAKLVQSAEQYRFSSAIDRIKQGVAIGDPLVADS